MSRSRERLREASVSSSSCIPRSPTLEKISRDIRTQIQPNSGDINGAQPVRMESSSPGNDAQRPSAPLPPAMAEIKSQSADKVLEEMNRLPLFMTSLDETDGEGGENVALEALKALAYEGTRAEIAENFRQQGNDSARAKQWTDAKEFYDKAIAALKGPRQPQDPEDVEDGPKVVEIEVDEEDEAKKERETEEACYVNRALCNLEKSKFQVFAPSIIYVFLRRVNWVCISALFHCLHYSTDAALTTLNERFFTLTLSRELSLVHP